MSEKYNHIAESIYKNTSIFPNGLVEKRHATNVIYEGSDISKRVVISCLSSLVQSLSKWGLLRADWGARGKMGQMGQKVPNCMSMHIKHYSTTWSLSIHYTLCIAETPHNRVYCLHRLRRRAVVLEVQLHSHLPRLLGALTAPASSFPAPSHPSLGIIPGGKMVKRLRPVNISPRYAQFLPFSVHVQKVNVGVSALKCIIF